MAYRKKRSRFHNGATSREDGEPVFLQEEEQPSLAGGRRGPDESGGRGTSAEEDPERSAPIGSDKYR